MGNIKKNDNNDNWNTSYAGGNIINNNDNDNWNGLYTKGNFKKNNNNNKITVNDNINKNEFLCHVMDHMLDDKF